MVDTGYGEKAIKLPAGQGILYTTTMPHRGAEVTSGTRLAAVTWIQSLVADPAQRKIIYDVGMVSLDSLMVDGPPGQAIGAGLRYYLPVGPVRVDVGYNPGELFSMSTRWAFHFAFGFSF